MNSKIWFLCNRRIKQPHIEIYWFPLQIVWRGEGVGGRSFLDFSLETLKTPRIGTSHGELSLDLRPQNTHPHPHRLELLVENFRQFDSVQTILCTGKLPSGYTQSVPQKTNTVTSIRSEKADFFPSKSLTAMLKSSVTTSTRLQGEVSFVSFYS